ncbi:MAG: hypothetical protein R3B93_28305 [Bacteroidia bacterium]
MPISEGQVSALTPNPFPTGIYPEILSEDSPISSEIAVNTENVNAAIARMGADNLDTRVWWDK